MRKIIIAIILVAIIILYAKNNEKKIPSTTVIVYTEYDSIIGIYPHAVVESNTFDNSQSIKVIDSLDKHEYHVIIPSTYRVTEKDN